MDEGESEDTIDEVEQLRQKVEAAGMPADVREKVESELQKLKMMSAMSAEATVVRSYVEWMLQVPWHKRTKVKKDIAKAQQVLDADHYGLERVKERILEYLAVQARLNKIKGPILCLVGPPGVGKTSLGQSIANATGRDTVSLGKGIKFENTLFSLEGNKIKLSFLDSNTSLSIDRTYKKSFAYRNRPNKDIKINFNNGKSLTYDQIKGIVDGKNKQVKNSIRYEYYDQIHIHSTPSQKKPLLQGSNGKDFLQGNNENNRFEGKNGDDVYYFSGSIGKDVIYDAGGNDKIYLDESFYGKDILFTKENLDLRISFPKSNESILIKDFSKTTEKVTTHRVFRRKKEMFNFNRIETLQVGNDVSVDINALINHMSSFAMRVNNGNLSIADSLEKLNKMGSI